MVLFNYATKEITIKVVYYGPGLCGKTTNLQFIHSQLNPKTRGKLISLSTETDRTLFFDFLPMEMGTIKGFKFRFQLYTVPGQVRYNATRKLVLKGSDGVVFVADSQRMMMDQNVESIQNLKENLLLNGLDPDEIPLVLQFNKRDLKDISTVSELNERLNYRGVPYFESIAIMGSGVLETFKEMTKILLKKMSEKHRAEVEEVIPPEEVKVKDESELHKTAVEDIYPEIKVERTITKEVTSEASEIAEEEAIEAVEYLSPSEEAIATEEEIPEGVKYPIESETTSGELTSVTESEIPTEEVTEEKPFKYAPPDFTEEILYLVKEISEKLDSVSEFLSDVKKVKEQLKVQGSEFKVFLDSISELKKSQDIIYRRLVENEEIHRRKTEEIIKSLNEIRGKIEDLKERSEKKWFGLR